MTGLWKIRAYQDGDEKDVMELYRRVYEKADLDEAEWMKWWTWQHKKNPAGPPIIWFADAGDRLAGQYEVVRIGMKVGDREGMASHSQDTMTHPDFRRQGIFEALANKTYEEGAGGGLFLVYGFPNQFSHPGFVNKLSWMDVCQVPNVFKPLNVRRTLRRRISNPLLLGIATLSVKAFISLFGRDARPRPVPGMEVSEVREFDESADRLWMAASRGFGIIATRDRAHLEWRYVRVPHRKYTILAARRGGDLLGFAVLALAEKEGFKGGEIVDLFAIDDLDVLVHLLAATMAHFRGVGADAVYSWTPRNKTYGKAFRKCGFLHMPPSPMFIVRPLSPGVPKDYLLDYSNWFVMMGDSDFH